MFTSNLADLRTGFVRFWRVALAGARFLSAIVCLFGINCFGQTFWTDGAGNWNTAGNWSLGVPNSASGTAFDAVIENGGTAELLGPPDGSVRRLRIGRAAGTGNVLVDTGATLTVTQDLYVNENGVGNSGMTVRNGSTVTVPTTNVGQNSAANSNVTISGALTSYNATTQFILGNMGLGPASLTVDDGGLLNSATSTMASFSGTTATAFVTDPGSTWSTTGGFTVGILGTGTLNVSNQGQVYVGTALSINSTSTINLNGGTLRLNTVSAGINRINYTAGTIQLAGDRYFYNDTLIPALFGTNPTIPGGKSLIIEGYSGMWGTTLTVNGGTFVSKAVMDIEDYNGEGVLLVTNAGKVISNSLCTIAFSAAATVSDPGSSWTIASDLLVAPEAHRGDLNVLNQGTVYVGGTFSLGSPAHFLLNGGTIRFNGYSRDPMSSITYSAGTVQLAGDRTTGSDAALSDFFGASPIIPTSKSLIVEGTVAVSSTGPVTMSGGTLTAAMIAILPGARLTVAAPSLVNGPVAASAGSLIDATATDVTVGDSSKVNGFYSSGTLNMGERTVTLADANDAVLDSAALVNLGNAGSPGTLNSANGLTLNFGGNITGYGTINTPNNIAKPLINNGHITGDSVLQPLTLPGYVKGVGTFDNVNFTGTFSPGLSPTILTVGNISLSPTSTLIVELGGASPGSGYDQIQSSGALAFSGTLQVSLINGFTPTAGQSFNLFDWRMTSGSFGALQLPALTGLTWNTSQLYTTGILSVGLPGDFNGNGVVDAADYVVWRKGLGMRYTPADYNVWRTHFGQSAGSGSSATLAIAIPEPATWQVLLLVAAGRLMGRRWIVS